MSLQVNGIEIIESPTESLNLPIGDNSQRPSTPVNGMMRYNTEYEKVEVYANGMWKVLVSSVISNIGTIGSGNSIIYSWGMSEYGEGLLPAGDAVVTVPTLSVATFNFIKIVCSVENNITFVIREDGTLWAVGRNNMGQLGLGDTTDRTTLTQVGVDTWTDISCYENHVAGIKTGGTLWTWGDNTYGQLAQGTTGGVLSSPDQVGSLAVWTSVACGKQHTIAVRGDGTLWGSGRNDYGQLGIGSTVDKNVMTVSGITNWLKVYCGAKSSYGTNLSQNLYSWGQNTFGQLGLGTTVDQNTPQQISGLNNIGSGAVGVGPYHVLAISNQQLYRWGRNNFGQLSTGNTTNLSSPTRYGTSSDWSFCAAGDGFSLASNNSSITYACGLNNQGQLGIGDTVNRLNFEAISTREINALVVGRNQSLFINLFGGAGAGQLWTWGSNDYGQLGQGDTTNRSSPVQVGTLANWRQVAGGWNHTAAVKTDGTLWSWGNNNDGQLGLNSITDSSIPRQNILGGNNWRQVAGGGNHTAAVKTDGTLWLWGRNGYGQLGLGNTTNRSSPVQVGLLINWQLVAGGGYHTAAVKTDGTLWSWGLNNYGQLGLGDQTNYSSPVQVGSLTNWRQVAGGWYHNAAVKTDGTLWTWGRDGYGQLGLGDTARQSSPVQVGSLTNWQQVACGRYNTAAVKTDGTLWSWGFNLIGELGLGNTTHRSSPVQVGTLTNWRQVAGGAFHTAAVKTDGTLWTWGRNFYGQLGLGNTDYQSSPVQVGSLTNWQQVDVGYDHTAAIKSS